MEHLERATVTGRAITKLQHAARIRRDHALRGGCQDRRHLFFKKPCDISVDA